MLREGEVPDIEGTTAAAPAGARPR